ncbi:MAG: hypothetical protein AAGA62_11755, partial [Bacteroidota bacterium]
MLRKLTFFAGLALVISGSLQAQNNFKKLPEAAPTSVAISVAEIKINPELRAVAVPPANNPLNRLTGFRFDLDKLNIPALPRRQGLKLSFDRESGQVFHVQGRPRNLKAIGPTELDARNYLEVLGADLGIDNPADEIVFTTVSV